MNCLQSKINIDNSTIEKLFLEPEKVLNNIQQFWETEKPCILALEWAPKTYPIHYKEFTRKISELNNQPIKDRKKNPIYIFANKIVKNKNILVEKVLPIICSYLPENSPFEATIHLTSYIYLSNPKTSEPKYQPNAFVREPNIVVNLSSKYWTHDENQMLNEKVHEIYHIAFAEQLGKYRPDLSIKSNEALHKNILWMLYYEGLATYVAYKSVSIFPIPEPVGDQGKTAGSHDFKMLENIEDVTESISIINELFSKVNSLSYEEAEELIREKGVMKRAIYVAGAYLAKMIEQKTNKETLINSLKKGPKHLIDTFNENTNKLKINY